MKTRLPDAKSHPQRNFTFAFRECYAATSDKSFSIAPFSTVRLRFKDRMDGNTTCVTDHPRLHKKTDSFY